jgi:hypothetical protein
MLEKLGVNPNIALAYYNACINEIAKRKGNASGVIVCDKEICNAIARKPEFKSCINRANCQKVFNTVARNKPNTKITQSNASKNKSATAIKSNSMLDSIIIAVAIALLSQLILFTLRQISVVVIAVICFAVICFAVIYIYSKFIKKQTVNIKLLATVSISVSLIMVVLGFLLPEFSTYGIWERIYIAGFPIFNMNSWMSSIRFILYAGAAYIYFCKGKKYSIPIFSMILAIAIAIPLVATVTSSMGIIVAIVFFGGFIAALLIGQKRGRLLYKVVCVWAIASILLCSAGALNSRAKGSDSTTSWFQKAPDSYTVRGNLSSFTITKDPTTHYEVTSTRHNDGSFTVILVRIVYISGCLIAAIVLGGCLYTLQKAEKKEMA